MLRLFETRNQQNVAAVAAYKRALELAPDSAEASVGLGIAQTMAGLTADAVRTFEAGIAKWPSDAMHYQAYGVLLLRMAETGAAPESRAASMLGKALDLDPSLAEAHYQLGQIALAHDEIEKSIEHFLAAVQNGDARGPFSRSETSMRPLLFLLGLSLIAVGPPALFTDVTERAGIRWTQFNGESPQRLLVESTTGGVAFIDFDQDGRLDLFLVNGGETPGGRSKAPVRNALYRNLGAGRFEDVTAKA